MKFQILVSLPKNDIKLAEAAIRAGVDGVKVHLNAHHRASGTNFGDFQSEKPFLQELGKFPVRKFVMAGQEKVPTPAEMNELAELGFEGFNLYLKHSVPHLFQSPLRPILALEHGYGDQDIQNICKNPNAWIEASIVDPSDYGKPLSIDDLKNYTDIVRKSQRTVIVPSQKKIETTDLSKLRETGVEALLIGVIVTGATAESIYESVSRFVEAAKKVK